MRNTLIISPRLSLWWWWCTRDCTYPTMEKELLAWLLSEYWPGNWSNTASLIVFLSNKVGLAEWLGNNLSISPQYLSFNYEPNKTQAGLPDPS